MQEDEETESDWWSVGEVAQEFDVDPETVRRWIRAGRLKATKPGGAKNSALRIHQVEVDRLAGVK